MTEHHDLRSRLAEALYRARIEVTPIPPLTETNPDLTLADAYAIQEGLVERLRADGGKIVGYKLGLTSAPMQELLGVDSPDYGPVLSSMVVDSGAAIRVADFIAPRIEAEIALILDQPLAGPGVSLSDATSAVGGASAALELVDSRIVDWRIGLIDTVADLASCGQIVLGSRKISTATIDLRLTGMMIERNGVLIDTGAGAAALGNPIGAVAWLANTLAPYGVRLEAGQVIMTGSLHKAFPVAVGDRIEATFDRLGSVACTFG